MYLFLFAIACVLLCRSCSAEVLNPSLDAYRHRRRDAWSKTLRTRRGLTLLLASLPLQLLPLRSLAVSESVLL